MIKISQTIQPETKPIDIIAATSFHVGHDYDGYGHKVPGIHEDRIYETSYGELIGLIRSTIAEHSGVAQRTSQPGNPRLILTLERREDPGPDYLNICLERETELTPGRNFSAISSWPLLRAQFWDSARARKTVDKMATTFIHDFPEELDAGGSYRKIDGTLTSLVTKYSVGNGTQQPSADAHLA